MSKNIKDVLRELKETKQEKQQEHPQRDYFTSPKPAAGPEKSSSDWSGSGWSGDRVRGNWGGGRDR
jgi:hypothetical protein